MTKFHVSADGMPHQCFASLRPCPLGGPENHYASESEARAGFEAQMASETFKPVSKGYTVTSLIQVGEATMDNGSGAPHQRLPLAGGFDTPKEAVEWAKANVREATSIVSLTNEDWDMNEVLKNGAPSGDPMETGNFRTLSLIDISEEKEILESKDVPTIGKYWVKRYGQYIKDEDSFRTHTSRLKVYLPQSLARRVTAYVRVATIGKSES